MSDRENYIQLFKKSLEDYSPISSQSWEEVKTLLEFQNLKKEEVLVNLGEKAKNLHFICKGALRAYFLDSEGKIYTKNLFLESTFAASTVSLLKDSPSYCTLDALEDSTIINLNYKKFRQLIFEKDDLKNFHIAYIEKNWIIDKEQREVSLVMEGATKRYLDLLNKYPDIDKRIQQFHIASHLGITPTQLSRIRKELKDGSLKLK